MIITAPLETNVLSPVNGTIAFQYTYFNSLSSNVVFGEKPTNYKADSLLLPSNQPMMLNLFVSISIKTNDGKVIHISGIRPVRSFKTGERGKAGDIIGKIGYFYNKISKPAIRFSITEKEKPIDPMSPFGLKSSFVDFKAKEVTFLSKEEANYDFDLFIGALKEIMPDIYDYVSESDFEKFVTSKKEELNTQVHIRDFERVIVNTINIIDSHLSILCSLIQ